MVAFFLEDRVLQTGCKGFKQYRHCWGYVEPSLRNVNISVENKRKLVPPQYQDFSVTSPSQCPAFTRNSFETYVHTITKTKLN
jgi:hypothetical protein